MRILISLLCAMVLVGCNATTSGERPDIKSEAPTLPEPNEKPAGLIENAFTMHLPMMCAKSDEFMKAISNLGEKYLATPKVEKKEKIDNSRFQPVGEPLTSY